MTRLILWTVLFVFFLSNSSCQNKSKPKSVTVTDTEVEWKKNTHNFGEITEGEEVLHTFYLKNTGKYHLLIKKIDSGCSCTQVEYDKTPIPPQKEGKIEIVFNSKGRFGKQYKEISIFANISDKKTKLIFTADVKEGNKQK